MEKEIVHCQIEEGIAIVTIDNPQSLNALNAATLTQLDQWFTDFTQNPNVQGVILTGGGEKSFVAGADISEFSQVTGITAPALMARGQRIFDKIEA
ncbi:MAG: enoyl-CoA hydratase-related protein, partial [Deltaproteobacteria bacterium]|nr:enoyl-CoA hydratase-related protein [Deltaproteobacteria bacterium]